MKREEREKSGALRNVSQPRLSPRPMPRSWAPAIVVSKEVGKRFEYNNSKEGGGKGEKEMRRGRGNGGDIPRYSRRCETLAVALVRRSLVPCASRGVSQNINLRLQIISCTCVSVFTRRDNFSLDSNIDIERSSSESIVFPSLVSAPKSLQGDATIP